MTPEKISYSPVPGMSFLSNKCICKSILFVKIDLCTLLCLKTNWISLKGMCIVLVQNLWYCRMFSEMDITLCHVLVFTDLQHIKRLSYAVSNTSWFDVVFYQSSKFIILSFLESNNWLQLYKFTISLSCKIKLRWTVKKFIFCLHHFLSICWVSCCLS